MSALDDLVEYGEVPYFDLIKARAELVSLRGEVLQWQQMCVTADGLRDTIKVQAEEMKNVRDLIDRQLNAGYISFTDRVDDMRRWLDTHPEVR